MQLSRLSPALLALLPVASAAYSYGGSGSGASSGSRNSDSSSSSGSTTSPATNVTIINVGENGLTMEPNDVDVPAGNVIEFHFFTGAHSVAQSAFDSPCTPLDTTDAQGFFSGSQRVESGESSNVFRVVSTGNPMWYYCATARHCQSGMVGVINKPANGERTIEQYAAAAAEASENVQPESIRGGEVAAAGSEVTTPGSGTQPNDDEGNAGVSSLGSLNLPIFALAVAVSALMAA
ncbi:Extracellular serine-rich protein (Fragment) [Madurella fahalii]|uniref:Extracellular serine-rich protein n=1 Tax=Madurella fahalii TaxID=1157608 RepID=A0ABQ0GHH2_9PEZI